MPGSQHLSASYNPCTSRSNYTYTTPLQQPMQSVSLINNSYSLPGGELIKKSLNNTQIILLIEYYLQPAVSSATSPTASTAPRRFDPPHSGFYNWGDSSRECLRLIC